jgi:hypothetical protein
MSNEPTTDAASDPTREPSTGSHDMSTADALPVPDGVAIPASPATEPPPTDGDATAATDVPAGAAAAVAAAPGASIAVPAADRARLSAVVIVRRLLGFAFTLALLVAGVYAGWQYYTASQPAPVAPGDPAVVGVPTPPIVSELASAIGADDANAIRVTLNAEMFSRYTADMERFGIQTIDGVTTLGTFADGPRTATALVILGRSADRNPFTINLVVIAQDGQIVRLR